MSKKVWKEVLPLIPGIIAAAKELYDSIRIGIGESRAEKKHGDINAELQGVRERVERLESNELEQAKLVQDIVKQLSDATSAVNLLYKRVMMALLFAVVALVFAVGLLIVK